MLLRSQGIVVQHALSMEVTEESGCLFHIGEHLHGGNVFCFSQHILDKGPAVDLTEFLQQLLFPAEQGAKEIVFLEDILCLAVLPFFAQLIICFFCQLRPLGMHIDLEPEADGRDSHARQLWEADVACLQEALSVYATCDASTQL